MTGAAKRKGSKAELDLQKWLVANGYPDAHRSRAGFSRDVGDILGVPGLVIEVKDQKTPRWSDWLEEVDAEKLNAGCQDGILVVKRPRMTDPGEWLAIRRVRDEFRDA